MLAPTKIYKVIDKHTKQVKEEVEAKASKIREGKPDLTEGQVMQLVAAIDPFLSGKAYALGMLNLELMGEELEKQGD